MPPRVEGLSFKQTRALRLLALGGGAMHHVAKRAVRFTHPEGGLHIDLPLIAVKDRLIALGYMKDMGLGTYMITPEGKRASDEAAAAHREMWKPHQERREEARRK